MLTKTKLMAIGILMFLLFVANAFAQTGEIAAWSILNGQGVSAKMYLDGTAFPNLIGIANSQGNLSISTSQGQHTIYCFYTKGLNNYIGSQSVYVKSYAPTSLRLSRPAHHTLLELKRSISCRS